MLFFYDRHEFGGLFTVGPGPTTLHLHYTSLRRLVACAVLAAAVVVVATAFSRPRRVIVATCAVGMVLTAALVLLALQQSPAAFASSVPDAGATFAVGASHIFPRPEMHAFLVGAVLALLSAVAALATAGVLAVSHRKRQTA
jgi:hypothetical protein